MRALDTEKMESSFKINLRDVSWWMSIKDVYRPRVPVTIRPLKEECISLVVGGRPSHMIKAGVGPLNLKNIFLQNGSIEKILLTK
jgi:hypothetical protein